MRNCNTQLAILLAVLSVGCDKLEADCGAEKLEADVVYGFELFKQPSEIYWGVTGNTRYYTYNWTFDNNCPGSNPKVTFLVVFKSDNNTFSNPFSLDAATQTCLGVQPQKAILSPQLGEHKTYESNESEIGMSQCFSGRSSAPIYPYISLSFTTLGSSKADSTYIASKLDIIKATRLYKIPK